MIIDQFTLQNFGAYKGTHQLILTPKDGQTVALIGGMNGGGKTTFLDAIQLALYGRRARTSNRGRSAYSKYLRACMNNMAPLTEPTKLQLTFRITLDGEEKQYQLTRQWSRINSDIEESLQICKDGVFDRDVTENWQDMIESYLPAKIAHLFFFDGEQIKKLAEGDATAEILGTAIQSLLGLDIVDQLQNDLRVFMRKKREEGLSPADQQKLETIQTQLRDLDQEIDKACQELGQLRNTAGQAHKILERKREQFRQQGGELWNTREEIEGTLEQLKVRKQEQESRLRELAASALPFSILKDPLQQVVTQVKADAESRKAKILVDEISQRDQRILQAAQQTQASAELLEQISKVMHEDLENIRSAASRKTVLDVEDGLELEIEHLQSVVLPTLLQEASDIIQEIRKLDTQIDQQTAIVERIPAEESLQKAIQEEQEADSEYEKTRKNVADKEDVLSTLRSQQKILEGQIDKLGHATVEAKYEEEDRIRMLRHSERVSETMKAFRTAVAQRHIEGLSALILECFQSLLRKGDLITSLSIDPTNFSMTLYGRDGNIHDFNRLSAGEQQLLATSILWGLARASGRPVPTIIDTPLGRLDSTHRINLVERYFPVASHQVILLSTDEEIVGRYFNALELNISHMYLLEHDKSTGCTTTKEGYFNSDETDT